MYFLKESINFSQLLMISNNFSPCTLLIHYAGFELPEEDREDAVEADLPRLPPDKDPRAQTLTKPQPKKKGQNKEMVRGRSPCS